MRRCNGQTDGARQPCKRCNNMFHFGTNCTKDLHISNKSRTFAAVFMNKLRSDALRSDCAGCFVVYLDKKIVYFTKNQLFFEKIVEKIC